jgi:hypothetical protein
MKMKNIAEANSAIMKFTTKRFTHSVARELVTLRKRIQAEFEFMAEERQKIANQYVLKDENGEPKIDDSGFYMFESIEKANEFKVEFYNLLESEIDEIKPVIIRDSDILDGDNCPEIAFMLDGFVSFVEG